jgi:hypothetical protein
MQRQIFNSNRGRPGNNSGRLGAALAMAGLLLLSACDSNDTVTDNNLPEPGKDGVPPVLEAVTIQPDGLVESGDSVRIDFTASEALKTPVVFINNVQAEVNGKIASWNAVREITDTDPVGDVTFSITYQDVSGELGQAVIATTDGSGACIGDECPRDDDLGPLEGNWQLEFAGVGPAEGDTSWFSIADTGPDGPRACWFDDIYEFGGDGSFRNVQGDETYVEPWQGVVEGCGAPVAPHDGSNNAVFEYDEEAATLQLTGLGAYLGLSKAVNGAELASPADTPDSVTYQVVELIGDSLIIRIDVGNGDAWWEFRLTRISNSPLVGNWKLNFAGVGPAEGDTSWFSIADTGPDGPRACWFDDIYHFGGDTSFQNFQGGESWVEPWQGAAEEACGTPVAPHDGSTAGTWYFDEAAGDLTLDGLGLFLGLPKVVNGGELTTPADTPESVTYKVVELVGDSLTVRIDVGAGDAWWEFRLERVPDTRELAGNWQLEFAGVGPTEGDTSWFSIADTGPDGPRACWFDDIHEFGRDGAFRNIQGDETWVEPWQGATEEACGAPVAPHDGSNNAVFDYDAEAGTLQLTGLGAYLGLAKVVNGAELATPADTPEFVTYQVVELIGDSMTVRVDVGTGWWEFRLARISNEPLIGNWKLDFAGVGPAEGDTSWFSIADTGPDGPRACWFDDIYHFSDDTSFQNFQGGESWVEPWQGAAEEACGTPVAPHDGSTAGTWNYDESAGDLMLDGLGLFLGLPKVVNGAELATPADTPESVTYKVFELIGGSLTVRIDVGAGDAWWEFRLVKEE